MDFRFLLSVQKGLKPLFLLGLIHTGREASLMLIMEAWATKLKIAWFAVFAVGAAWFLYWISYDLFVWQKSLSQVPIVNYAGLTLSITLFTFGFLIGRVSWQKKTLSQPREQKRSGESGQMSAFTRVQQPTTEPSFPSDTSFKLSLTQKRAEDQQEKVEPKNREHPIGCIHFIGYLRERPKSTAIPDNCISCKNVVECLSGE